MPIGEYAPGPEASLRLYHPSGFRLCDKMPKNQRRAPRERLLRIANGMILVAIGIIHQKRADAIWPHLRRQAAILFPLAIVFATNLRPRHVDAAPAGAKTMAAQRPGLFRQFLDFENLAAKMAGAAGFSGDFRH